MLAFRFVTSVVAAIGYAEPNHRYKISKSRFLNAKNSVKHRISRLSLQILSRDDPNVSFSCPLSESPLDHVT
jgi:hypothetical protein